MMFSFNEDQEAIKDAAEKIFAEYCDDDAVKSLAKTGAPLHSELWTQLAEAGILGLALSEELGGSGMSLVELALVVELQGKFVAPVPLVSHVIESMAVLANGDNEALKTSVLPGAVDGSLILSPVRQYSGIQDVEPLKAEPSDAGWALSGRSGFVPYANVAGGYVITVTDTNDENVILYCRRDTHGLQVTEQRSVNDESAGFVSFDSVELTDSHLVARGEAAERLIARQQQDAWVALSAMQTGVLEEGIKRAAAYVSERKQFGKPLGAFQAVSQQAANAYMEVESLRCAYWRALDDIEQNKDYALSSAVAKYWTGEAGHKAAHTFLHLHGGIGQDLDYPIHRFFLFAKHLERYLGVPSKMAAFVGDQVLSRLDELLEAS